MCNTSSHSFENPVLHWSNNCCVFETRRFPCFLVSFTIRIDAAVNQDICNHNNSYQEICKKNWKSRTLIQLRSNFLAVWKWDMLQTTWLHNYNVREYLVHITFLICWIRKKLSVLEPRYKTKASGTCWMSLALAIMLYGVKTQESEEVPDNSKRNELRNNLGYEISRCQAGLWNCFAYEITIIYSK